MPSPVSVPDHRAAIAQLLGPGRAVSVALDRHQLGRRLAADLVAADDLPRFDASAMDGYAAHPAHDGQRAFVVVGDIPAGSALDVELGPGEAARVMTGARLPVGTVGVVPVELTDASATGAAPSQVVLEVDVQPGRHIRRRGEDLTEGTLFATSGSLVTPALIALARSAGCSQARVHAPTRLAVVATGAELVWADRRPGPGGIHESNSDMVAALATQAGCDVAAVHTCTDDPAELASLLDSLDSGRDLDLVVTTGGVSVGAYEVVRQVCEPTDSFSFVHVAMQPGGPQGLGTWGATPVVCLPGTPAGAFVGFRMLVQPALDDRHGTPPPSPRTATWTGAPRATRRGLVQYVTAVHRADGGVTAPDARALTALAEATVLLEVPPEVEKIEPGDTVRVHPL